MITLMLSLVVLLFGCGLAWHGVTADPSLAFETRR